MTASQTLQDVIDAQAGAALSTDDIIVLMLPLFEEVAALHEQGKVADLAPASVLLAGDQALHLAAPAGQPAQMDIGAINRVQPAPLSGLNIIGTLQRDASLGGLQEVTDLALQTDIDAPVTRPVYLPGPRSWEHSVGHHDEITDVYSLGMALASLACGLDFTDEQDLRAFVAQRRNLFGLAQRLHPIVAAVITEMTQVNRHERATDVAALATRLRTWRDQPAGIDIDRALSGSSNLTSRRTAVLSHLRDRLFDLSRRNRLLHFRPSASTINLTVASVPLMLQLERVRAEDICTWGGPFATDLIAERPIALQQWLRFDDQPYLPAAFDKLIAETRRDRAEYGFSTLRLVVAFLRWHNLKENPEERILTPLLWLPVELVKRKGVRDQYVLRNTGEPAEFNPVLRHQLSQLYGITLPETCDLNEVSVQQIHADLLAQIRQSEPSVELRLIEKASVSKVRQKAVARLQQYQRRKAGTAQRSTGKHWLPPYSYARDDYRPLGLSMFDHWVRPSPLPQRFEAGAKPQARVRQPFMLPPEPEQDREGYVLEESDGHRYAWDLDLTQVTLANFNYKKMSLVRDYNQLLESPDDNPAFDRVFSIEPRPLDDSRPAPLPYAQQWNVVNADATQNTAVSLARSERSFIIQGPPGTGKSQTITNLIADYAGRGQRVLFVCEKRAALDVVFHRLKQSGLEPLCCLIHDAQDDKKAFIADLKGCYEQGLASPALDAALRQQRDALVTQLEAAGGRIEAFEQALQQAPESLGQTVRALLRRLAELPDAPDATPAVREALPTLSRWSQHRELAQRLHRMLQERFAIDGLGGHAFAQLAGELVNDERAYARCEQLCEDGDALFQQLDALLESSTSLIAAHTPSSRR
ncbi:DUF4011 domain-containing protein [Pseudomonas sp. KNUC1026]|uniref:DUF4011 domain-containing protein n=1 Tax=Pseudomonas sp. KNUC1026 TaxID=2893890 RepID=UPI002E301A6D|nr:DUF4011 domain-containing protein [Pseudomonas sp. KNUC1026]